MRRFWLSPLVLLVFLAACSQPSPKADPPAVSNTAPTQSGQWILQNYDSDKGYTFRRDGVSYQTRCDHVFHKGTGIRQDASDQTLCVRVLPYLHKTIPIDNASENINGMIAFIDGDDVLAFEIKQAK
jgi:hypothetical protein